MSLCICLNLESALAIVGLSEKLRERVSINRGFKMRNKSIKLPSVIAAIEIPINGSLSRLRLINENVIERTIKAINPVNLSRNTDANDFD